MSSQGVTFNENTFNENTLRRYSTSKSTGSNPEEEELQKQDWTTTTDEKDSWANRERRRTSVWNGLDAAGVHKKRADSNNSSNGAGERRGSILSLWSSGKDKDGKHILHHDDHDDEVIVEDGHITRVTQKPKSPTLSPLSPRDARRGSILSMWSSGKDEKGRSIIHHADDD